MNQPSGPNEAGDTPTSASSADRLEVVAWLAERDANCPICSYNLRSAPSDACPECGSALTLAITSPNLQHGAWTLATSSFAMALGFDVVTLLLFGGVWVFSATNPPPAMMLVGMCLAFLALMSGAGLFSLARDRRVFQRRPQRLQWRISVGVFIGVGLLHAVGGVAIIAVMRGVI